MRGSMIFFPIAVDNKTRYEDSKSELDREPTSILSSFSLTFIPTENLKSTQRAYHMP